jgi:hypothetical protein
MDSTPIDFYQDCIKTLLAEYESLNTDWASIETLFDDQKKRYMVMRVGWNGQKRVHVCLVHIDIQDGMVVIQANNTEDELEDELVERGIPRENICLGLLPPDVRASLRALRPQQQPVQHTYNTQQM